MNRFGKLLALVPLNPGKPVPQAQDTEAVLRIAHNGQRGDQKKAGNVLREELRFLANFEVSGRQLRNLRPQDSPYLFSAGTSGRGANPFWGASMGAKSFSNWPPIESSSGSPPIQWRLNAERTQTAKRPKVNLLMPPARGPNVSAPAPPKASDKPPPFGS